MLTQKTRYAFKALIVLARHYDEPVLIAEISEEKSIPKKFLESILRELKHHKILAAQRGRGGGYRLRHDPADVTLADVHRALEGPIAPLPCLSRTAYERCQDCPSEDACGVRRVLQELYEAEVSILERTTVLDLLHATQSPK